MKFEGMSLDPEKEIVMALYVGHTILAHIAARVGNIEATLIHSLSRGVTEKELDEQDIIALDAVIEMLAGERNAEFVAADDAAAIDKLIADSQREG
jgi:hypothetical protein